MDFWPRYCAPAQGADPPFDPHENGCCSISDGTVDRCRNSNYVQIKVGHYWQRCYKGRKCQFRLPQPHPQATVAHWKCGNTQESVRWGLYWDLLQVNYHCDGKVEWNPWFCGNEKFLLSDQPATTLKDRINAAGTNPGNLYRTSYDWASQNKQAVCEGIGAELMYDEFLKPSSVCWRAGMSGRSSFFGTHTNYGKKTSLAEMEEEFKPFQDVRHQDPMQTALLAIAENKTAEETMHQTNKSFENFIDPFQLYCAVSGGTDCAAIGMERCMCYCLIPGESCTQLIAGKYAKALLVILELAADIALAVASGGTSVAAKSAAKVTAKAVMKHATKTALKKGATSVGKKIATSTLKAAYKSKKLWRKLGRSWMGKKIQGQITKKVFGKGIFSHLKTLATKKAMGAGVSAAVGAVCEEIVGQVFKQGMSEGDFPDWYNDPKYKFEDFEAFDITGATTLVGIFHEADCPAPIPDVRGFGCAR